MTNLTAPPRAYFTINFEGLPKPLNYTVLTEEEIDANFERQTTKLIAPRLESWRNNGAGKAERVEVFGGVTCTFKYDTDDRYLSFKIAAVRDVLTNVLTNDYYKVIPDNAMTFYCDGRAQGSTGYVRWDATARKRVALMFMGYGLVDQGSSPTVACTLVEKGKFTGSAKQFHTKVAVCHEYGHIFHQLHRPAHYFALADCSTFWGDGMTLTDIQASPDFTTRFARFRGYTKQDLKNLKAALKKWTAIIGGYCHSANENPNEYVAEFFAGRKGANVPFVNLAKMQAVYDGLGGPTII